MYLQFINDLETPQEYNWGGAVLAHLYRELSRACLAGVDTISGPMLLLQIWSWTRFTIGRPNPREEPPPFGGADEDTRNAFGVKWTTRHLWKHNPHLGGTATYRDSFDRLADETVNWRPYVDYYDQLPRHVQGQKRYWMSCGYVIHFWMVEYQHADRVMRQFGRYQEIPPPPPLPYRS
ncbi:serine/threonine-protein phosphatase 7 long form homolog [Carex rostrata]